MLSIIKRTVFAVIILLFAAITHSSAQSYTNLFSFTGNEGYNPQTTPVPYGNKLYGSSGFFAYSYGWEAVNLYSLNLDGTQGKKFIDLESLNVQSISGTLCIFNNIIYGISSYSIYKVRTDGTGYSDIYLLSGTDYGDNIYNFSLSGLTLHNNMLYGTTTSGGTDGGGTLFSLNTDGSNFRILRYFNNTVTNGFRPHGVLTISGEIIYGMTAGGGAHSEGYGGGTVYSVKTDGTSFRLLHSFLVTNGVAYPADARNPIASVLLAGNTIFGVTSGGGVSNNGTLFSIGIDGSNYTILHHFKKLGDGYFTTGLSDSSEADRYAGDEMLCMYGTTLYGITPQGGGV